MASSQDIWRKNEVHRLNPDMRLSYCMYNCTVPRRNCSKQIFGFSLPEVTGEYHVGTRGFELTDTSRRDIVDGSKSRILVGQIWYPTEQDQGEIAVYVDERLVAHMKKPPVTALSMRHWIVWLL